MKVTSKTCICDEHKQDRRAVAGSIRHKSRNVMLFTRPAVKKLYLACSRVDNTWFYSIVAKYWTGRSPSDQLVVFINFKLYSSWGSGVIGVCLIIDKYEKIRKTNVNLLSNNLYLLGAVLGNTSYYRSRSWVIKIRSNHINNHFKYYV